MYSWLCLELWARKYWWNRELTPELFPGNHLSQERVVREENTSMYNGVISLLTNPSSTLNKESSKDSMIDRLYDRHESPQLDLSVIFIAWQRHDRGWYRNNSYDAADFHIGRVQVFRSTKKGQA